MEVSLFSIYLVLSVLVLVIALITCGFIYLTFIAGMANVTMEVLFCLTMTILEGCSYTHRGLIKVSSGTSLIFQKDRFMSDTKAEGSDHTLVFSFKSN